MRITSRINKPRGRAAVLGLVAALAVVAIAVAWVEGSPVVAAIALVAGATLVVGAKALLEVAGDVERVQQRADSLTIQTAKLDEMGRLLADNHNHLQMRVDDAEHRGAATSDHVDEVAKQLSGLASQVRAIEGFNEAVLDRVRAVEGAASGQEGFNEAVLDRVRAVEGATSGQEGFNEAVLDRVRAAEGAVGRQEGFNEAALARIRVVESRVPNQRVPNQREVPPGGARRAARARDMIASALTAIEESRFFPPDPPELPALDSIDQIGGGDAPLISVIATCYNEEQFVAAAIESIRSQSFADWECIVVDDASTDGSLQRIEATIDGDPRFRLLGLPENSDVAAARNAGLRLARGRFVVFHDADDLLMADSLADRVAVMEATGDPDVAGVYCGVRIVDENALLSELSAAEKWNPTPPFLDFVSANGECPFGVTVLLRTDVVKAQGGFDESVGHAEDWEFWYRIMRAGFYFLPAESMTYAYRQKTGSKAQTHAPQHVQRSNQLIGSAYSEFEPGGAMLASYPFRHSLARYQQLLTQARRAIQYASTALIRGDVSAFESILGTLEQGSWPLVNRHIDVSTRISDGFRRGVGLDIADLADLESELQPLADIASSGVRRATL